MVKKSSIKISNLKNTHISSPIASSQDLGWESIFMEEFKQPPGSGKFDPDNEHIIGLCLGTKPYRIWQAIGDRSYLGVYSKGDLSITPAKLPWSYKVYGDDHYLQIKIAPEFFKKVALEDLETDPDRLQLNPEFRTRNPQIEQLAMMLRKELHRGDNGVGRLYIDSLANALTVNLVRDYAETKAKVAIYEGGLGDRKLIEVIEYINEHLDRKIKLADIANAIDISQFHFSRLFKKSMGISPHQYLLEQRIDRAKQLLKNKNLSVIEIAFRCGFNSHSHLTEKMGFKPRRSTTAFKYLCYYDTSIFSIKNCLF